MLRRTLLLVAIIATLAGGGRADPLQFSFGAPNGWQLRPDPARERYYWLAPVRNLGRRCSIRLGAEAVSTPEESQSDKSVRFREVFSGPGEPIIRRSTLRSLSGDRILKADVRWNLFDPSPTGPQAFRSIVYSFRGRDGRVYTFECYPPVRMGTVFDRALDDLARSIKL